MNVNTVASDNDKYCKEKYTPERPKNLRRLGAFTRLHILLERLAPAETSEHQQGTNTLGTKQRVWNFLPVPDNN